MAPFRLFVHGGIGNRTQSTDHAAICSHARGRDSCAWRLVHEWHEFVGEDGHGATDADTSDIRAAADSAHPPTLGHVAIDHGTPAANFHQAFRRTVLMREVALLVISCAIAAFMHGFSEQPRGPKLFIE